MKNALKEATKEWKCLERKTARQREQAEDYYATHLMKLIEESFVEHNQDKVTEPVEYMIYSVGTSYEPLVLSIRLFQPTKILFLYTERTETVLNRIVQYCGLDISGIYKQQVNETEPLDIYREIKKAYLRWNRPEKLYIDFTGGTKAMSAAAAMAGSLIKVQLVYVGTNDYLVDFRKPDPGSETLYFISNPLEVFGDLEIEKAFSLFSEHNYSGACEKLQVLKEQVPDPALRQQLNFVYLLGRGYEAWDALDFQKAHECFEKLNMQLIRDSRLNPTFLMMDLIGTLKAQEKILADMLSIPVFAKEKNQMGIFHDKECMVSLMFSLYQNAVVREEQEKYDMATLLLYRLLEMVEQKRLSNYDLNVYSMDYGKIPYEACKMPNASTAEASQKIDWLKGEMLSVRKQLFKKATSTYLPDKISLLDGFTILYVLQDDICVKGKNSGVNKLKQIRSMVSLRNNSIFAHGLGPVSVQDFSGFKRFVENIFHEFCQLEDIPYEEMREKTVWLTPFQSRYYSGMEM